jgi:CheY-like chemotaxis protein
MTRPSTAAARTILYAEDDSDDAFFMQRAFRAARCEELLQIVSDGEQAIAYLAGTGAFADRQRHPLPALVLLDINMPICTGLDVLKWRRDQAALASLPVVVLTSSSLEADMNRALALGAIRYLVKPGHPDGLVELVKSLEQYWTPAASKGPARSLVA